jgi:hypothetical protein
MSANDDPENFPRLPDGQDDGADAPPPSTQPQAQPPQSAWPPPLPPPTTDSPTQARPLYPQAAPPSQPMHPYSGQPGPTYGPPPYSYGPYAPYGPYGGPQPPTTPSYPGYGQPGYAAPSRPLAPFFPPTGQPPIGQPPQPPKRGLNVWQWALIGASGLLVLCCVLGMLSSAVNGSPAIDAAPTITLAPTATDTPDPNDPALVQAYQVMVAADDGGMRSDAQTAATDCGNEDLVDCRNDMAQLNSDATSFLADLDQTPAPPCLSDADSQLRQALTLMKQGTGMGVTAIDTLDATLLKKATAKLNQAGKPYRAAIASIADAASC